jgi:hypothetical protein
MRTPGSYDYPGPARTAVQRLHGGAVVCQRCGAVLLLAGDDLPEVVFLVLPNQPVVRVLTVRGRELHRCEVIRRDPR